MHTFGLYQIPCFLFRPLSCTLQTIRHPAGAQTAASFATIQLPLQKLLFSATMTHSPEKLAPLQLYQPTLFTGTGSVNQTKTTDLGKPTSGTCRKSSAVCFVVFKKSAVVPREVCVISSQLS